MYKLAPSLKPGPHLAEDCVTHKTRAIAIRNAWRFVFPVTWMTQEALEAIDPKVIFVGY